MHCPACHSNHLVKNGFNPLHKQIYRCQECGRQFVQDPAKGPISDEKKALIDRLLLERISLAGIARKSFTQSHYNHGGQQGFAVRLP